MGGMLFWDCQLKVTSKKKKILEDAGLSYMARAEASQNIKDCKKYE
jgi:hypothetical protein